MSRGLSPYFMQALFNNTGSGLQLLLQAVLEDETLDLEIRENCINIYYRGGSLMRVSETKERFLASFDRRYIVDPTKTKLPSFISDMWLTSQKEIGLWVANIPFLKYEMDRWFHFHPKDEREFQQLIVRENNLCDVARGTDYFICDIEYDNDCGRFDMVAVCWPSASESRKKNSGLGLAFIEMKYMDKSMVSTSGILAHLRSMEEYFRQTQDNFADLKQEMKQVFNQKLALGLIRNKKPIEGFSDDAPDFIFVLANHDPASQILYSEMARIAPFIPNLPFKVKFATGNFLGYGLYQEGIFCFEEFVQRYSKQIFSGSKQVGV